MHKDRKKTGEWQFEIGFEDNGETEKGVSH